MNVDVEQRPGRGLSYRRREPEHTLLYRVVASEIAALRGQLSAASPYGTGLPRHVEKELEGYLRCGILAYGFARVVCRRCRAEHLVGFSCKGRGICPSCTTRRMHDTAAHLVDRVIPRVPVRQWVITFPRRVRYHLAADPKLATGALRELLRTIFALQRRQARRLGARPERAHSNGAITFVQRFNSALELSLHYHVLIPDGVFVRDGDDLDARPRFVKIDPPTNDELADLLDRMIDRVVALLRRHGRFEEDVTDEPEPHLLVAARPPKSGAQQFVDEPLPFMCIRKDGFSLHAGSAVQANDRNGLGRLCRYGLRPPLAQGRLSEGPDGSVCYEMKRRFSDGRHMLRFAPHEFLLRLCALVPPRGFHMVRYAGIFAAHARGRYALTGRGMRDRSAADHSPPPPRPIDNGPLPTQACPAAPATASISVDLAPRRSSTKAGAPAPLRHHSDGADDRGAPAPLWSQPQSADDPGRQRRLAWAVLLRRTWDLDVLACPRCGERMELIAAIDNERTARKILEHLDLPARPPPRGRPWRLRPSPTRIR